MTETNSRARWGAAIVAGAPLVVAAGLFAHPFVAVPTDESAFAEALATAPTRWALAHLIFGVGAALLAVAFVAIRSYLRHAGENDWSRWAWPFAVIGSGLAAILPGMEFAPYAAAEIGADVQAAQEAIFPYFVPVFLTGGVLFAVGAYGFTRAILVSRVMRPGMARVVASSLIVLAIARLVPLGAVQLYVHGAAVLVALWPIAMTMWDKPEPRMVGRPAPA